CLVLVEPGNQRLAARTGLMTRHVVEDVTLAGDGLTGVHRSFLGAQYITLDTALGARARPADPFSTPGSRQPTLVGRNERAAAADLVKDRPARDVAGLEASVIRLTYIDGRRRARTHERARAVEGAWLPYRSRHARSLEVVAVLDAGRGLLSCR